MQVLTEGIHSLLGLMFDLTGSYGSAILLLTLSIRLVLLPFALLSERASRNSSTMQAKVKAIQERFSGEEAERQLRELHAQMGRGILAGCIPALAQWPVLFAMYSALSNFAFTIPAGFFWLDNLGAPDPYFVLPLLVMGTQLWQSVITVPPGQRKIALAQFYLFRRNVMQASH